MKITGLIRGFLIGISYHSVKKVIDKYPEPIRKIIISLVRICFFMIIFLSLFSFFTTKISAIGSNVDIPKVFGNVLIGMCFLLSVVIGFILMAVIEEIYRKLSEIKQRAEQRIEVVKNKALAPSKIIKKSLHSGKAILINTGSLISNNSKNLYKVTAKITSVAFDATFLKIKKTLRKKDNNT
ncbi:MAG: hypothetical protein KAJ18_03210 [Candidatus Omnitrophica bacterium]|nr:hypothetical protein [Candidatus Omnitrophota bacterium]